MCVCVCVCVCFCECVCLCVCVCVCVCDGNLLIAVFLINRCHIYRLVPVCFLTELFDPSRWAVKLLRPAGEMHRWSTSGFIHLTSHSPYCISWFSMWYACMARIFLGICYPMLNWDGKFVGQMEIWSLWITFKVQQCLYYCKVAPPRLQRNAYITS